ncbi:MAG: energy transducer TonB, partial [Terriglobales bacterium]
MAVPSFLLALIAWAVISAAGAPAKTPHQDVDFGPYMSKLQATIKTAWEPPQSDASKHAVVIFKVNSDGSIANARVQSTSGNETFDRAALGTLKKVHLDPLPAGSGKNVDIQFTFEYNVHHPRSNRTAGHGIGT